jgi:hypothetical protein
MSEPETLRRTRGNLVAARIVEVDPDDIATNVTDGLRVDCMFNPFEYTVTKTNQFRAGTQPRGNNPQGEFVQSGAQTLTLSLVFDTYETGENVARKTNDLWKFMMVDESEQSSSSSEDEKVPPPLAAFEWGGGFRFVAFITNMTQKFTLFKTDGTPVRANVTVTFTQYHDVDDYGPQNPSSGSGPAERIRQVIAGDRIDGIAAEEYQDATKWRMIAEHNHITNPLVLKVGMYLRIPIE